MDILVRSTRVFNSDLASKHQRFDCRQSLHRSTTFSSNNEEGAPCTTTSDTEGNPSSRLSSSRLESGSHGHLLELCFCFVMM